MPQINKFEILFYSIYKSYYLKIAPIKRIKI